MCALINSTTGDHKAAGLLARRSARTPATGTVLLDWRARHRAVGAEHAAITLLGAQQGVAGRAFVEELARRGGHGLGRLMPARRARQ